MAIALSVFQMNRIKNVVDTRPCGGISGKEAKQMTKRNRVSRNKLYGHRRIRSRHYVQISGSAQEETGSNDSQRRGSSNPGNLRRGSG